MATPGTSFPAIRAFIFDMDGLLINSEDKLSQAINQLLEKYERPLLTDFVRARLMGVHDSTNGDFFHDWAKLSIPREQWRHEIREQMRQNFLNCEPLPGAERLLSNLSRAVGVQSGEKLELALASSTNVPAFESKTSKKATKQLLDTFQSQRRILGDDPRLRDGRAKPAPDIYQLALEVINSTIPSGKPAVLPNECLVVEDSVAGVEAGRRAGMRVVWVPHPALAAEYQAREKDILAGRVGVSELGDEWQLGEIDDGWAESIKSLEHFDCDKYGIKVLS